MATLVTEQGIVHYEAHGRGRPVLLLHGWLGSWALWHNTILELGKEFRTYALDFWGFGESGDQGMDFSVDNFVVLVNQFVDRLGIPNAPLVGHSMGGTVSLGTAIQQPEKVVKVIVIGSPIQGTSLSLLLKLASFDGWLSLSRRLPMVFTVFMRGLRLFMGGYAHLLAHDGRALGKMMDADLANLSGNTFFESIGTLRKTDLSPRMGEIKMPVLGIYGARDLIVNPNQSKVLKATTPHSKVAWFEQSGHFPMLDEPTRFHSTVRDFLNNG
ncbi:MAG: alpha/beta hydrolase [Anaerolineae bacterium]|nr:alpha/beta hydrolase [Anaerolineae bacterium]